MRSQGNGLEDYGATKTTSRRPFVYYISKNVCSKTLAIPSFISINSSNDSGKTLSFDKGCDNLYLHLNKPPSMKTLRLKQLALISVFFLIACQEDSLVEEIDPVDEDMIAATLLADDYFNELGGRTGSEARSITILKYDDGNIYFNTNTDDIDGYQIVTETTVTAYVEPGEFVFWYRGGGLDDLEGVDFDEDAEAYLDQLPDEYKYDMMWVLKVPEEYDPEHDELKYDIVYESKDNKGVVIRLDPKIVIGGNVQDPPPGQED